ncbi:predicted protein [Coccidioides posadasii str. Silveira]|uniref:Predicted protein n=1 Tax=Coccidioides posadasii (strain RMSCC 757 / Silveira) TaxID=443226 RepID=E9CZ26_COCPS|nr:predicted protein [Coccidioides posadasii str. Silveira]
MKAPVSIRRPKSHEIIERLEASGIRSGDDETCFENARSTRSQSSGMEPTTSPPDDTQRRGVAGRVRLSVSGVGAG